MKKNESVNRKKSIPPVNNQPIHFRTPELQSRRLQNGLKVIVVERHDVPKVSVRLGINFGLKNCPPDLGGLSDLLTICLKKGAAGRSHAEIVSAVESLGGELDTSINSDCSFVFGEFFTEYLDRGMQLFRDITLHPDFPEQEVEKERQIMLANLENENSSTEFLAHRRMDHAIYDPHPYGLHKSMESLSKIKRSHLVESYTRYYSPRDSVLIFAGDIRMSEAIAKAEKYFGDWQAGQKQDTQFPPPQKNETRRLFLVNRPGSEQSTLLLGKPLFPRNHPDYTPFSVLNKILGGGASDRLFRVLRGEKGFTYGAYSGMQNYKEAGSWLASADVRTPVTVDALETCIDQIRLLREEPVRNDELDNARKYIIGSFPLKNETVGAIAALTMRQQMYDLPDDYWTKFLDAVAEVQIPDLQEMANRYLSDTDLSIVVVGDAEYLTGKLDGFGKVEIWDAADHRIS